MKKYVAILCICVAILAAGWKLVSIGFSISPTSSITSIAPDGTPKTARIHRSWVELGPMVATEGANLLVTKDGVELLSSGGVSVKSQLAVTIDKIFWWILTLLTLGVGVILFIQTRLESLAKTGNRL
ncbi:hypothetical protein LJC36_01625 [Desulfovibrio sp. OttesenSCG-928-C14]|nr:hypothetical protein [Desulfovibrio sp. OttesenSCG-928-C14]